MDKVKFLQDIGVKNTKEIQKNPKIKQIINYIKDKNISYLANSDYINEEKFFIFYYKYEKCR